jgi:hypothetical protein
VFTFKLFQHTFTITNVETIQNMQAPVEGEEKARARAGMVGGVLGGTGRRHGKGEKARTGMVWGMLGGAERRHGKEQDSQCRERCDLCLFID